VLETPSQVLLLRDLLKMTSTMMEVMTMEYCSWRHRRKSQYKPHHGLEPLALEDAIPTLALQAPKLPRRCRPLHTVTRGRHPMNHDTLPRFVATFTKFFLFLLSHTLSDAKWASSLFVMG
jgi:hypothetical protein